MKKEADGIPSARAQEKIRLTDLRDEEILQAAFQIFTEKGFHGATMLAVANRARASKATIYARFQDKNRLFHALLDWGCRQTMADLQHIAEDPSRSPDQALCDFASKLLTSMAAPSAIGLLRIAIAEGVRQPEVGLIYNSLTRDVVINQLRILMERLQRAGIVAIDDPAEFGRSLIGLLRGDAINQALLGASPPPDPIELERSAHQAMSRLLRAFAPHRKTETDLT